MPAATPPTAGWRYHWPVMVLAVMAALVAAWARHHLYPAFSWNRDEPVYLWHVEALRAGQLTPTDAGFPDLFQPWLSARGNGVFFTQYTLGWPLVLLAAVVLTGSAANALLLGATLAVLGTYAITIELYDDRRIALGASALMVASPILAIQGGVYLSYLFTLGLGLLFGSLLLRGIRLERALPLVGAGILIGWIFMTRPYDAVLWTAAFAGYAAVRERGRWPRLARLLSLCCAGAIPIVIATLAYNHHVTGGWFSFPITSADPMDTFGFGQKRLMPTFEVVDYDVTTALRATAKNALLLPWFLFGGYLGLVLAGTGLWHRRRDSSSLALVLVGAVFTVGYFVFWGNHLSSLASRISGPIYLIPVYPVVCILMSAAIAHLWTRRRVAYAVLVVLTVGTLPGAISRFEVNREISLQQTSWQTSTEGLTGRSIVFVADTSPYLLYLNPFSSNNADLDGTILYAADNGPAMLDLIAASPDRRPYLQQASVPSEDIGPREHPLDLDVRLVPITIERGASIDITITVSRERSARDEVLHVDTGASEIRAPLDGPTSRVVTRVVTLVPPGGSGGLVAADRGTLSITVGGTTPRERVDLTYRVTDTVIEVMVPAATYEWRLVGTERLRRRTLTLADLVVTVSPSR
ncbi:MAG: hypothetical protein WD691_02085 [Acidimicrobiales bacterium]